MSKYLVLIDIRGIQDYIFSSSKLKENIGASIIVKDLFKTINSVISRKLSLNLVNSWEKDPISLFCIENNSIDIEVGFIGGGNTLLVMKNKEMTNLYIREFSKNLLLYAPGLSFSYAKKEIKDSIVLKSNNFGIILKELHELLIKEKYKPRRPLNPENHPFFMKCNHSGLFAEHFIQDEFISTEAAKKLQCFNNQRRYFEDLLLDEEMSKFRFVDDLDDLGNEEKNSNYIAIIHIDGNKMGNRFKKCRNLQEIRELSISVEKVNCHALKNLISFIHSNIDLIGKKYGIKELILPIRPMIIGGDDITLIASGKLGLFIAEKYLQNLNKENLSDQEPLFACAGICITKKKYPIYRSYALSEELCKSAKKNSKRKEKSFWFDFHITNLGFSGDLQEIRESIYRVKQGDLLYRPYEINSTDGDHNFDELKVKTKLMMTNPETIWSKSKIHELSKVLTEDKGKIKLFLQKNEHRGRTLPEVYGKALMKSEGWQDDKTVYFDMIELMKYYPFFLEEK